MMTDFADPDDTLNFTLTIEPDEGMYKSGRFHFTFAIPQSFPHEAPKVKCTQKIYHPNIDLEGNVCLNILREDWKPVLNLQAVIIGIQVGAPMNACTGDLGLSGERFTDTRHVVPLPRAQRIGPAEQRGRGGFTVEQRGLQTERARGDGGRGGKAPDLR